MITGSTGSEAATFVFAAVCTLCPILDTNRVLAASDVVENGWGTGSGSCTGHLSALAGLAADSAVVRLLKW